MTLQELTERERASAELTTAEQRSIARARLRVAQAHLAHVRDNERVATLERVAAVQHAKAAGMTVPEIATTLGISRQAVYLISD